MGPKQKTQAEANAENTSGPHDVGRPSAAPHHVVAAAEGPATISSIGFRLASALAPYCIVCFGPILHLHPLVLAASLYISPYLFWLKGFGAQPSLAYIPIHTSGGPVQRV